MLIDPASLKRIPFFAGLTDNSPALTKLCEATRVEKYDTGQILFLEGDPCRGLFYVTKGRVRIFKSEPDGREQILRMAGEALLLTRSQFLMADFLLPA